MDEGIEGGNIYCWAYDEAVCAKGGNTRTPSGYPWCSNTRDEKDGAISDEGVVTDYSCPCTVPNKVSPLGAVSFK
jgi:hypothetical protein